MPADVEVIGTEPELQGLCCEELICEGFVADGKLEADANVVFIRAGGFWHRLVIDAGVVFWRKQEQEPTPWVVPEKDWFYPHRNVAEEFGLSGQEIDSIRIGRQNDAVEVLVCFRNGKSFALKNANDASSFAVD